MKKLLLSVGLMALVSTFASAQIVKFGVRAGVSSSSINVDDLRIAVTDQTFAPIEAKAGSATIGYHFGAMAQINVPLLPLMIIPELLYTSTGGEVEVSTLNSAGAAVTSIREQKFGRLDIPVMVALKAGPARFQVGPVASFVLSEDNGFLAAVKESVATVQEEKASGATFGFQAGVGVNILSTLALDLKYEGNLSKMGDGVNVGGTSYTLDSRPSQLMLSIGYLF